MGEKILPGKERNKVKGGDHSPSYLYQATQDLRRGCILRGKLRKEKKGSVFTASSLRRYRKKAGV